MSKIKLTDSCNITTGKLDSNAFEPNGLYPFFTCSPEPLKINEYAFDDDVILLAGNNASGNFHCNRFTGKFNAYQRTYVITAKEGYDIDYIFYNLKINLAHLKKIAQGSQTKFLTMKILDGFTVEDIGIGEQIQLSRILKSIDDKISTNNRINSELESMAKTIYDYWFTQFDFPDENGKPYRSSGGKMVWNDELKREIPEGWEVKKLSDFSSVITKGTTPSTIGREFVDKSGISFIKVESIENGFINTDISYISEKTHELMQRSKLEENDILITIAGRLGSVCVVPKFILPANTNQAVAIVRLTRKDLVWFLRVSMMSEENKYYYSNVNAQSIQKNLNLPNVGNTRIICDNGLKYADLYNKKVVSIYKKINSNIQQNQQLASLRDWLLPMLINGQVGF